MTPGDIRTILLTEWDPLDVGDNPHLADEYDSYIAGLFRLLKRNADAAAVAQHLKEIEIQLGVNLPPEGRMRAASRLVAIVK